MKITNVYPLNYSHNIQASEKPTIEAYIRKGTCCQDWKMENVCFLILIDHVGINERNL